MMTNISYKEVLSVGSKNGDDFENELRSRNKHISDKQDSSNIFNNNNRVIIEHTINNGENLMQIALKYSVQVSLINFR